MKTFLLFFFCLFAHLSCIEGQVNFRSDFEKSNPVSEDSTLSLEEKLAIHVAFLKEATKENDSHKKLFANLHIFLDHIRMERYTDAASYLLEAEKIAEASKNPSWEGWVKYRSGILYIRIGQEEKAIENYLKSVTLCGQVGDSLCLGESLEQVGALKGVLGEHEVAASYFSQAIPILKAHGEQKNVATALNNYGSLLSMRGDYLKSIPIMKEGIEVNQKIKKYGAAAKGINNLANTYRSLGQFDQAAAYYDQAIRLNRKHGFAQNIIRNYMGLHILHFTKKEYEKSLDFLVKRYELKDSLIGEATQLKIATLEKDYAIKDKELKLEKAQSSLLETKRSLERFLWVASLLILLTGFGIWYLIARAKKIKHQRATAERDLKELTKILIDKNSTILALNDQLSSQAKTATKKELTNEEFELFVNTSILTGEDWVAYKANFERLYPGFLHKLRSEYPTLSDAEERLFLLIKVQLKTREIAAILGVSTDTVKKTRQRLRKRLDLDKDLSLDNFVKNY